MFKPTRCVTLLNKDHDYAVGKDKPGNYKMNGLRRNDDKQRTKNWYHKIILQKADLNQNLQIFKQIWQA